MADYTITFAHSARKELQDFPNSLTRRIFPRIKALANPKPSLRNVAEAPSQDWTSVIRSDKGLDHFDWKEHGLRNGPGSRFTFKKRKRCKAETLVEVHRSRFGVYDDCRATVVLRHHHRQLENEPQQ